MHIDWVSLHKESVFLCAGRFHLKSHQRAECYDLEHWFQEKEGGKHNVEVLQDIIVDQRCTFELQTHTDRKAMRTALVTYDALYFTQRATSTFIMRTMVLSAIRAMMLYSKGGDTTNCHIRYWKLSLFFGMWRVRGLALMAKSIQARWMRRREGRRVTVNLLLAQDIWKSTKQI